LNCNELEQQILDLRPGYFGWFFPFTRAGKFPELNVWVL
jgi:hypothetical protein